MHETSIVISSKASSDEADYYGATNRPPDFMAETQAQLSHLKTMVAEVLSMAHFSQALQSDIAVCWLREVLQQDLHKLGLEYVTQGDPRQESLQRCQRRPVHETAGVISTFPICPNLDLEAASSDAENMQIMCSDLEAMERGVLSRGCELHTHLQKKSVGYCPHT